MSSSPREDTATSKIASLERTVQTLRQELERLKESEKWYRSFSILLRQMCDGVQDMIWAKDLEKRYIFANKAVCENLLNAVDTSEPIGKTDLFFALREREAHSENPSWHTFGEVCSDSDTLTMQAGRPMQFDEFGNVKGRFLFLNVRKAPFFDPQGKMIGTVGSARDVTEIKRVEEALHCNEMLLNETQKLAKIGGWSWDVDRQSMTWTEETYRIHEMAPGDIPPGSAEHIAQSAACYPPDVRTVVLDAFKRCAMTGEPYDLEVPFTTTQGRKLWVRTMAEAVKSGGRVVKVVGNLIDITDRKAAEERLSQSESKLNSIFRAAPIGIGVVCDRAFVDVNDLFCKMIGYAREELIGKNSRMIYPTDEDYDFVGREKYRQINQQGTGQVETRLKCKGGEILEVIMSSTPLDPADLSAGVTFTALDITKRKQAESALRESEARYRGIVENAIEGLFQSTPEGRFISVNSAFATMLGYGTPNEMVHAISDIAEQYYADPHDRRRYKDLLVRDGAIKDFEFQVRRKDGSLIWVSNSTRSIYDQEGKLIRYEGIVINITARKEAEEENRRLQEQLFHAQKMESVGRLAGGVAHDFNNMLAIILGHTEMALDQVAKEIPLHADLEEIRKAANRSAELTRQLLAFARKQTVAPKVLDLNRTVEGMLKMLRRLIGEEIDLLWQPASVLWPIKVDPSQIDQILANLCVNSRDAISGTGQVVIRTHNETFVQRVDRPNGDFVMLSVSDNGSGMSPEALSHVFEPFFTTKEVGRGTGLGLATVYGIVKQNRGFVDVFSRPGEGAAFKIYFPRESRQAENGDTEGAVENLPGGQETLLLVEDDASMLAMGKKMLEKRGYRVLAAQKPNEALALAVQHAGAIRLLITDVVMPEMNGRLLADRLLALCPALKILFISGYTADVIANRGVLEEGVNFVQKPFTIRDLAFKVRETLDKEGF
jgi:PAS domain S-box-containing protein